MGKNEVPKAPDQPQLCACGHLACPSNLPVYSLLSEASATKRGNITPILYEAKKVECS